MRWRLRSLVLGSLSEPLQQSPLRRGQGHSPGRQATLRAPAAAAVQQRRGCALEDGSLRSPPRGSARTHTRTHTRRPSQQSAL